MPNTRRPPTDSDYAPLEAPHPKRSFMKFDSTVTSGNILTAAAALASVAMGWGMLTARMDAADVRATAQRAEFTQAISDVREALKEQRTETKELQRSLSTITTDTALIRGRLASSDSQAGRSK